MSRVLIRQSSDNLRRSYLRDAVGTPARAMLDDGGGPSMLYRGQFDPSLEINYVDDPRLAVGETFTRVTIGTTVDFEGRVLTCLIGEPRFYGMRRVYNLLRFSQDFTNGSWSRSNVSVQGGDPISQTKRLADRIVETAGAGEHYLEQSGLNVPQGGTACAWATVKPGRRTKFYVAVMQRDGATVLGAIFDLSAASVVSTEAGVTAAIYPAGDGLLKCVVVVSSGTGGNAIRARYQLLDASGTKIYTGDGASYVWMREAQVEDISGQSWQGASEYVSVDVLAAPYHGAGVDGVRYHVTDYLGKKIPRYTATAPAVGRCGLLRERASTNLLLQSAFAASWTAVTATLTANTTASPDGGIDAATLKEDATVTALHAVTQAVTQAANVNSTVSVFVKRGAGTRHLALVVQAGTDYFRTYFDLATGSVGAHDVGGTGSWASASVIAWGSYFICTMTGIASSTVANPTISVRMSLGTTVGSDVYSGDNASTLIVFGGQYEALDHRTSYIPTTTAAVTRNKDSIALATGTWFNAAEGAIAVEAQPTYLGASISECVDISDGTSSNSMRLSRSTAAAVWGVVNGGGVQASITNGTWLSTAPKRAAAAYKANDFQEAFDGVLGTQDTAGTPPTVTTLTIGDRGATGFDWDGFIGRVHYFPRRLPDAQLAAAPQGSY